MPKELLKNIEEDIQTLIWEKDPFFQEKEKGTEKRFKDQKTNKDHRVI